MISIFRPFPTLLLTLSTMCLSPHAHADTWAVGAAIDSGSGLSVLYRQNAAIAYHISAHTKTTDEVSANIDLQRYFLKTSLGIGTFPVWLNAYGGIGVRSFASRYISAGEEAYLRLPLGIEVAPWHIPIDMFADAAVNIGPVPRTVAYVTPRIGVRATF